MAFDYKMPRWARRLFRRPTAAEIMSEYMAETGVRTLKCALAKAWARSEPLEPTTAEILDAIDDFTEIVKNSVRRGDADAVREAIASSRRNQGA